jgi:hypothetical protein
LDEKTPVMGEVESARCGAAAECVLELKALPPVEADQPFTCPPSDGKANGTVITIKPKSKPVIIMRGLLTLNLSFRAVNVERVGVMYGTDVTYSLVEMRQPISESDVAQQRPV